MQSEGYDPRSGFFHTKESKYIYRREALDFIKKKIYEKTRNEENSRLKNYFNSNFFKHQLLNLIMKYVPSKPIEREYFSRCFDEKFKELTDESRNKLEKLKSENENMESVFNLLSKGCPPQFYKTVISFPKDYYISSVFETECVENLSHLFFSLSEQKQIEALKETQNWEKSLRKTIKKRIVLYIATAFSTISSLTILANKEFGAESYQERILLNMWCFIIPAAIAFIILRNCCPRKEELFSENTAIKQLNQICEKLISDSDEISLETKENPTDKYASLHGALPSDNNLTIPLLKMSELKAIHEEYTVK